MPRKKDTRHASGLVEVKVTIGKTLDGKRIQKSFYGNSKLEAKRKAEEYKLNQEVANQTGDIFIKKEYTFGEWAIKWLETYKKGKVKDHTYKFTYKVNVEKYIIPYFGKSNLNNIKQADVQMYFNSLKLAKSTLEKHKMILSDIFDKAIYNDYCVKNPVKDIVIIGAIPPIRNVWTADETSIALDYLIDNKIGVGLIIMLFTGIRRSELCGLMWSDIDFDNKTVRIQRAVTPSDVGYRIDTTKTISSNRIIPISEKCINFLNSLDRQSDYIVYNRVGGFLSPGSFAKQFKEIMNNLCSETNLKILTPHELRHTYGTILREKGVDIYSIQKALGHADISITAKIYVHNDIEVLRKNMLL